MVINNSHKIIKLSGLVFMFLCMLDCSHTHKMATVDTYPFEILFGNEGGFTNINPCFIVKSSGEILKKDNSSSDSYLLKRMDKHKIDSLYLLIGESNFGNLKIKQISNFTHYIEIKSGKFNNKIMWFNDSQIPVEVKNLYQSLINAVNK